LNRIVRRSGGRKAKRRLQRTSPLGEFTNFPMVIHGVAKATCDEHSARVQLSVIRALSKLNRLEKAYPVSVSGRAGTYEGRASFEIGVGEGIYFNYLDDDMTKKLCESVTPRRMYTVLDFLVIVTYHYNRQGRNVHLNFDHHQLRFIFHDEGFEIRLFHSKGIRRMPLDELLNRILESIIIEMKRQSLKPLMIEELHVL